MKFNTVTFYTNLKIILLLTSMHLLWVPCMAQKIAPEQGVRLYSTPEAWQELNLARLKNLPVAEQQAYSNRNAELVKEGKHYTVGPTTVSGIPLDRLVEHLYTNWTQLPHPAPAPPQPQSPCLEILAQPTDPAVDMRDYGIVTQVRNQNYEANQCGSCWDFGTVAAFETSVLLQNGNVNGVTAVNLALSEQQVLDCVGSQVLNIISDSCNGGNQAFAADYICANPIVTEAILPYTGGQASCPASFPPSNYQGANWVWICNLPWNVTAGIQDIKKAICTHGSIVSCIQVTTDFENYSGGVYDNNDGACAEPFPTPNHVIQIIGWDDSKQAWLIKNSWGTGWGIGGFAWVGYNVLNIGSWALAIDARKFNGNACGTPIAANPKLIGTVVTFNNAGQGLESQDNYWLYFRLGQNGNNNIGTFSYDNQNQGYNQNQTVNNRLALGQTDITLSELQQQGAQLEIDRHGQFGGLHFNSDWNSGVSVTMVFNDGSQKSVSWGAQNMYCDHNQPFLKWIGQIPWNPTPITNNFLGIKTIVPVGFLAGSVSMQQGNSF